MAERMMKGFPPLPEGQVTLANWRLSPFNRWALHHVREIIPTADIPHDPTDTRELPDQPQDLSRLPIAIPGGDTVPLARFLDDSSTDGIVVLHKGSLVFERYGNGMTARSPHILFSISKSMLALVAGVLAGRGVLDVDRLATDYVPEVRDTAFAGATVRHLLDMRTGLVFDENYAATSGPIIDYRKATGWNPLAPGEQPADLRSFFRRLTEADRPHGGRFHYISVNTDLLGWIVERAAGQRFADLMSELIWQPMGAADSAYLSIDRFGASRCAGGVCTTTRDLARVGQIIADQGARGIATDHPRGLDRGHRRQRRHRRLERRQLHRALSRRRHALPLEMVRRAWAEAAAVRHGHPRPESVHRSRQQHSDREVFVAGAAARRRAHRGDRGDGCRDQKGARQHVTGGLQRLISTAKAQGICRPPAVPTPAR